LFGFGLYFSSFLGFFSFYFCGFVPPLKRSEMEKDWAKEKKREKTAESEAESEV